jgi:hypothetical protein
MSKLETFTNAAELARSKTKILQNSLEQKDTSPLLACCCMAHYAVPGQRLATLAYYNFCGARSASSLNCGSGVCALPLQLLYQSVRGEFGSKMARL